jgi:L-lactate dehydrogenase complex protein LldF
VKIDIPRHLVHMRRDIVKQELNGSLERKIYRLWAWVMKSPWRYRWATRLQKSNLRDRARGGAWVKKLPKVASGWTQIRDLPTPAEKTFHELWRKKLKNGEKI